MVTWYVLLCVWLIHYIHAYKYLIQHRRVMYSDCMDNIDNSMKSKKSVPVVTQCNYLTEVRFEQKRIFFKRFSRFTLSWVILGSLMLTPINSIRVVIKWSGPSKGSKPFLFTSFCWPATRMEFMNKLHTANKQVAFYYSKI